MSLRPGWVCGATAPPVDRGFWLGTSVRSRLGAGLGEGVSGSTWIRPPGVGDHLGRRTVLPSSVAAPGCAVAGQPGLTWVLSM